MKDKFFLDTNIIVYTFDQSAKEKKKKAQSLVRLALSSGHGIISFQVLQEFLFVSSSKFKTPLSAAERIGFIDQFLSSLCQVYPNIALYKEAISIQERFKLSFYDSLIISAAIEAKCDTIYSEDLQHGQRIGNLSIVNPFL